MLLMHFTVHIDSILSKKKEQIQSTLCFTTRGSAANLGIATSTPATDLCQYINSNLVFSDLKFWPLCSETASKYPKLKLHMKN